MTYPRNEITQPGLNMDQVDKGLEELSDRQLATYAAQYDHTQLEGRAFEYLPYEVQRNMRASNAIAKRARLAAREVAKKAEADTRKAEDEAEITAHLDSVKKHWKGTDAEFRAAAPGLRQQFVIDQARQAVDSLDVVKSKLLASGRYQGL